MGTEINRPLTAGIVIATRNRPGPLKDTLLSLGTQTQRPDIVVIVDSSDEDSSKTEVDGLAASVGYPLLYQRADRPSAARQRNQGVSAIETDVVVFLDDDVIVEPAFLRELMAVFDADTESAVGGVSGTITNQVYSPPSRLNRFLLAICTGDWSADYAGRLIGPAVNFLPRDIPNTVQDVEWLPAGCTAYRRQVFLSHRFSPQFEGYSFAEDVHLSSRVRKTHRLLNTTRARLYHLDLGGSTHRDWRRLGESMVINRHCIMNFVLGRNRLRDYIQLFGYEIVYGSLTWLAGGVSPVRLVQLAGLMQGKLTGFWTILIGQSPHQLATMPESPRAGRS